MLFTVAEQLILASGTYPCQSTYRGQVIFGGIRLEGSQVPTGEMFDVPGTWVEGEGEGYRSFGPHEDTVGVLRGRLRSGYEMVLLDIRMQALAAGTIVGGWPDSAHGIGAARTAAV